MSVAISAGVRNAVNSLSSIGSAAQESQFRLSTGKKVNSAVDNAVNFFTSAALNTRAGQISSLLDGIGAGIKTIQAASKGLDAITKLVQSAQSTIKQAQGDTGSRPSVTSTASIGTAASVTATGKTTKEVTLAAQLGGTAADATATVAQQLGIGTAAFHLQLSVGDKSYTDTTLSATSKVSDVVDSINKSGLATASVGDDGKLTIKTSTSDKLTFGIGSGADSAAAKLAAESDTGSANDKLGLAKTLAKTGVEPVASSVRSALVSQFNDLRTQIDQLAKDSGYNGVNLLTGDKLSVIFNEKTGTNQNKLDIQGQNIDSETLGIKTATINSAETFNINFQSDSSLAKATDGLTATLASLRTTASTFGSNLGVVQTRQDFSKDMISMLKAGADDLVLADTTAEGATLLALQTRQQLSQTALTLSNQADQAVLRMFS
jgi:flagellin-like hook-associated protein FlgL